MLKPTTLDAPSFRSGSEGREQLNYEKQVYHNHLDKLRLAHKVEVKNLKILLFSIADEVFKKKLFSFRDFMEKEIRHLADYIFTLEKTLKSSTRAL